MDIVLLIFSSPVVLDTMFSQTEGGGSLLHNQDREQDVVGYVTKLDHFIV